MQNKFLIELIVPEMEISYSLYIPVSKRIGDIINLLCKAISEFTNGQFKYSEKTCLYNSLTGEKYRINDIVYATTIRNGDQLVLL